MAEEAHQGDELRNASLHTLRPRFRYHVAALAGLACVASGWSGFFDIGHGRVAGGLVFGILSVTIVLGLIHTLRRQSALLRDYVPTIGTLTEWKKGRRGSLIRYRFEAIDGKSYEAESPRSVEGLRQGQRVAVLYKTLDPSVSLPLRGFIFYSVTSFDSEGALSRY